MPINRSLFSVVAAVVVASFSVGASHAACNATVNGRAMTQEECALGMRVYGQVTPGAYLMDEYGNWVYINNPSLRGNTYLDAQRLSSGGGNTGNYGGSWGGRSYVSPRGVYDASGGCEGGSCVNIID